MKNIKSVDKVKMGYFSGDGRKSLEILLRM